MYLEGDPEAELAVRADALIVWKFPVVVKQLASDDLRLIVGQEFMNGLEDAVSLRFTKKWIDQNKLEQGFIIRVFNGKVKLLPEVEQGPAGPMGLKADYRRNESQNILEFLATFLWKGF